VGNLCPPAKAPEFGQSWTKVQRAKFLNLLAVAGIAEQVPGFPSLLILLPIVLEQPHFFDFFDFAVKILYY
jgi:hypothetical protein